MNESNLPGEWKVSDLKKNRHWLFELDDSDQKELISATKLALKSGNNFSINLVVNLMILANKIISSAKKTQLKIKKELEMEVHMEV